MNFKEKFSKFITDAKRVLVISKKPSQEEFFASLKVTGIGLSIIGIVGLIVYLVFYFIVGA